MIRFSDEIARQFDLAMGAFGHAGDGNLHPIIRADKNIANPGKIRGD
jgi:glycolate oxidase